MEQLIMSKGELKKLANQKNILTDITLFAESEKEPFSEVQIITLNEHLNELALEQALNDFKEFPPLSDDPLVVEAMLSDHIDNLRWRIYFNAKEYVQVFEDSIQIAVNTPIIDDSAVDYALSLLIQIEKFNPGDKHEFGKRKVRPTCA